MSASSFTDWSVSCDHPGCDQQEFASNVEACDLTATALRSRLKRRGWVVSVPASDGSRKRKDYCPHHNPDLAVRVRAALDDGGWAGFSSRADTGNIILNAPGREGSWRSLVTEQCADYLNGLGFRTEIINDSLHVSED